MLHDTYEAVIGLEVHAQLLTESKAFSPESAAFGGEPNVHVDPVSLGHPGTLPVLNEQVVAFTLRMGLATHCHVTPRSVFARKHYFYPDLPKGYQISQYETPICYGGYLEIALDEAGHGDGADGPPVKRIGITRIHMEEDAGRSLHDQDPYDTLVDYNRCGVPLMEIVSEPDLRSPREAYRYLQEIRQIVRYLGICDGNMEEGSLRCDANVSVRRRGQRAYGTKTEVKNMNSFRNVERALDYEIARQIAVLQNGGVITQQTLLWDAAKLETRPMRSKEFAHDYRYFPDPDLVQVVVTEALLDEARGALPEMPDALRRRFVETLGLPAYDARLLTEEHDVAAYFEKALAALYQRTKGGDTRGQAKALSNFVMTEVLRVLNERGSTLAVFPIEPDRLAGLVYLRLEDQVSSSGAQDLFNAMLESPEAPEALAREHNLLQVSDAGALLPVVEEVIRAHPRQVDQYLGGKHGLLGFFIGQVMKRFPGAPDPKMVSQLLRDALASRQDA